jgi:5-methyltetrahydrofolate--homocysteine methyltransferase
MAPLGPLTPEKARDAFAEQAAALAEGGADLIQVETMSDLAEATAAVEAAREATSLPVLATMSFETRRRTMMGVKPAEAAQALLAAGATAVGANCGRSLEEAEQVIQEMHEAVPDAILIAKPNAGVPKLMDRRPVYEVTPEEFAEFAQRFVEAGAKIVGGCCGTTPAHIAAVVRTLKEESRG